MSGPAMDKTTERGFRYTEFTYRDYQGEPVRRFSIQESSLATEHKVWVGADAERAHLGIDEARIVRDALSEWIAQYSYDESEAALDEAMETRFTPVNDLERDAAQHLMDAALVSGPEMTPDQALFLTRTVLLHVADFLAGKQS